MVSPPHTTIAVEMATIPLEKKLLYASGDGYDLPFLWFGFENGWRNEEIGEGGRFLVGNEREKARREKEQRGERRKAGAGISSLFGLR
jgi:hypothetical protein